MRVLRLVVGLEAEVVVVTVVVAVVAALVATLVVAAVVLVQLMLVVAAGKEKGNGRVERLSCLGTCL